MNKVYLILKNHGKFSIALALFTISNSSNKTDCEVTVEGKKFYSNPAMLQYVFNDIFMKCLGTLEADAFMDVMEKVGDSLGVAIKVSKEPTNEQARLIDDLLQENHRLKEDIDRVRKIEYTSQDAAFYKRMYNELLDRLIAKG